MGLLLSHEHMTPSSDAWGLVPRHGLHDLHSLLQDLAGRLCATKITDVQNGAEILVDDFDPEARAQQTLAQKAENARHHAARMLRQTKVHNPDAFSLHLMTNINMSLCYCIVSVASCILCKVNSADLQACSVCIKKHIVVQAIDVIQSVQKQQHAESLASIQKADRS